MPTYITHSREETVALGKRAAAVLPAGSLIPFMTVPFVESRSST